MPPMPCDEIICLEAALVNIKARYSDSTRLLEVCSSTISRLKESVQTMGQKLSGVMLEWYIREYQLAESNAMIAKLLTALPIS